MLESVRQQFVDEKSLMSHEPKATRKSTSAAL